MSCDGVGTRMMLLKAFYVEVVVKCAREFVIHDQIM